MSSVKGDGSVYRRKDGKWVAALDLGLDAEGHRRRATRICRTKPEATQELRNLRMDKASGRLSSHHSRDTLSAYMEAWLSDVVKPRRSYNTHRLYATMHRLYIEPRLGSVKLSELDDAQVQRFCNEVEHAVSAQTAKVAYGVLNTALELAHKKHLIPQNPCRYVEPPHPRAKQVQVWTRQQAESFLVSIKGDRLEAYFAVAIALGLRKGEALALRWSDVDLEAGTLTVRHNLIRVKGEGLKLSPTKTRQSERTLYIPPPLLPRLREHRRRQLAERLEASEWADNDFVFTSKRGMPLEQSHLSKHFNMLCARAKLPRLRVHDMRHLAASLLIAQGVELKVVSGIMGHSSIAITANTYGHLFSEQLQDAAERAGRIFKAAE